MMRFGHVNIVARDWRRLVKFYQEVFECEPVGPERNLKADWINESAGIEVTIEGQHLRLPGTEATLEVFSYTPLQEIEPPMPNRTGFGHIAFVVDDVPAMLERVIAAGGSKLGTPRQGEIQGAGTIELVYCRDPEGNIVELQRWL